MSFSFDLAVPVKVPVTVDCCGEKSLFFDAKGLEELFSTCLCEVVKHTEFFLSRRRTVELIIFPSVPRSGGERIDLIYELSKKPGFKS